MSSGLEEDEYVGEELEGLDLAGETLRERLFDDCVLKGWTLNEAALRSCRFDDCTFRGCDLTMAKLYDCRLRGVRFERCKLMGVDFSLAYQLGFDVSFEDCVLSYASFSGMNVKGLEVIRCRAHEAIFDDADLRDADFTESDLAGARFSGADLRGADLSGASGYVIDPAYSKLKGTRMSIEGALATARLFGIEVDGF